jgi:hypothetical protein
MTHKRDFERRQRDKTGNGGKPRTHKGLGRTTARKQHQIWLRVNRPMVQKEGMSEAEEVK